MRKQKAIDAFGSGVELAKALGVTKQRISSFPDPLPQKYIDWVVGAAIRQGIDVELLLDTPPQDQEAA